MAFAADLESRVKLPANVATGSWWYERKSYTRKLGGQLNTKFLHMDAYRSHYLRSWHMRSSALRIHGPRGCLTCAVVESPYRCNARYPQLSLPNIKLEHDFRTCSIMGAKLLHKGAPSTFFLRNFKDVHLYTRIYAVKGTTRYQSFSRT